MSLLSRGKPALLALAATTVAATTAPSLAHAQDATTTVATETVAASEPPWSLTASGGISARDDGPDGSWQSLALTRTGKRSYLRASAMRYHGTLLQSDTALPSDYYVGTIGGGGNFNGWVVDGWASYGLQVYGKISDPFGSRESTGAKSSDYYAAGGDFGRVFVLGRTWFVTPTIAGSYAYGKLLRPSPPELDIPDLETSEPTWSASGGVRVDHAFGPDGRNYMGLMVSRNWASNGISSLEVDFDSLATDTPIVDSKHYSDQWMEAGATASMSLTRRLRLDLVATRGFGVRSGDYTNAGISLRRSF